MRIALADDDADFLAQVARTLSFLLEERGVDAEVVSFASAEELQSAKGKSFDIYFLDVVMPGTDGVELARRIRREQPDAPIVFLTTSKEHSLEAYSVHAADYVVKPLANDVLAAALDRAIRQLALVRPAELTLKGAAGVVRLSAADIVFAEAADHYQVVHTVGSGSHTFGLSMQGLWEKLAGDVRFVRVGRQLIVNLEHVASIGGGVLTLSDGRALPVPRRVVPGLKSAFVRFYRG